MTQTPEPCTRPGCQRKAGDCSHVECPRRRPLTACPPGYRDWEALTLPEDGRTEPERVE